MSNDMKMIMENWRKIQKGTKKLKMNELNETLRLHEESEPLSGGLSDLERVDEPSPEQMEAVSALIGVHMEQSGIEGDIKDGADHMLTLGGDSTADYKAALEEASITLGQGIHYDTITNTSPELVFRAIEKLAGEGI